jgi:hypothetical protein
MFGQRRREQRRENRREFGPGGTLSTTDAPEFAVNRRRLLDRKRARRASVRGRRKGLAPPPDAHFRGSPAGICAKSRSVCCESKAAWRSKAPPVNRWRWSRKALIAPLPERWAVNVANGPELEVQGNILDHEYSIGEGRDKIAEISKKWFRVADTYGVEIEQGHNDVLLLAVTVAIDTMAHAGH